MRYDCSWWLAPRGSKGILVASQKVSYPYLSSHRICGSSSKVRQPQGCLGRSTVAGYKVTVLHRKDRGQDTVSVHTCLGFTVFPQSNGSQHRATPPKLTLSSVRISVLGIWVSAIQEGEGPEILLQISSEQPLGQWNIMHQMLTEPRVKIFNARAVCRRFNRRNTNIGLNVKLRRGPQLTVWLHTGTTREHGLGGICQVTGPEHEEDTGTIATTHSTTHPLS